MARLQVEQAEMAGRVAVRYPERRPLFAVPWQRDNEFTGGELVLRRCCSELSENVGRAVPVIEWILFLGLSALLVAFTLRRRHAYRFWRWVAFECALALVVMSAGAWFADPVSSRQVDLVGVAFTLRFLRRGRRVASAHGRAPSGDLERRRNS